MFHIGQLKLLGQMPIEWNLIIADKSRISRQYSVLALIKLRFEQAPNAFWMPYSEIDGITVYNSKTRVSFQNRRQLVNTWSWLPITGNLKNLSFMTIFD